MPHPRIIAAAGCLTLGVGDLALLDLAVLPRVLGREALADAAATEPPREGPVAGAPPPVVAPAVTLVAPALPAPRRLGFRLDDAALGEAARASLDQIAELMAGEPSLVCHIEGHADALGSEQHNDRLSQARADAVAAYLGERGVDRARMVVASFGERVPLARAERGQRRRVEIRFALLGEGGPP